VNRSIETRLKRLEKASAQERLSCRSHIVSARTPAEADANIAALVANGTADPDDFFILLTPFQPDPASYMHKNYRWDEAAGRWEPKDGSSAEIGCGFTGLGA
jgi:hypothetical protein